MDEDRVIRCLYSLGYYTLTERENLDRNRIFYERNREAIEKKSYCAV